MTNQEKKEFAKQFKNLMQSLDATFNEPVKSIWCSLKRKAVEDLIGFLEEDSALDKIRAEIKALECPFGPCGEWYDGVADCLKIIDKYKAESEE